MEWGREKKPYELRFKYFQDNHYDGFGQELEPPKHTERLQ